MSSSGLEYGRGLRRTPSRTLKTTVLAPTPAASVMSVMTVNMGARPNLRRTCLSSLLKDSMAYPSPSACPAKRHTLFCCTTERYDGEREKFHGILAYA